MRLGHKYVEVEADEPARTGLDSTPDDHRESNVYDELRFDTRDEFLAYCEQEWIVELREALERLLDKDRSVLSLGSGKGEHEVPLFLDGYDIAASDIVADALEDAARLFPGFRALRFDILDPPGDAAYDDVLMTGIDAFLDDSQLERALHNARGILNPGGRVIFVLRYPDNAATRFIDRALLPAEAALRRRLGRVPQGKRIVKRAHGHRRSRGEVVALAQRCGFAIGRIEHAAYGMELDRVRAIGAVPRLRGAVKRMDRRLTKLNSATVFELLT